ncbi:glycosyltransferase family 4 protein [Legionella geestiana]|uniref:glycosyltransferase family 4 protein n=1 Tax=Legionella geestiana TaxID=45065 RepID=UPI0010928CEA|nr:glycosyltransferase family 4 protein [Legionella geestiana]QDQ40008.1 glycosyltransferase family 4 protein [Legionella geestiana]
MHILYFHQHYTNRDGGGGTRSYEFARRLVARGHRVTMVCGHNTSGSTGLKGPFKRGMRCGEVEGIDIIELYLPYSNAMGFLKRTLVFLAFSWRSVVVALTHRYDLVFATSTPLTAGIPGIIAKFLRRKAFVFEVRDLWPELPEAMGVITNPLVLKAMSVLEWVSYRAANCCIGLAPGIVEGIRRRTPSKDIVLVPNGCDPDLFADPPEITVRDWGAENFVAIFAGAHGTANGLDALLDVAAELKRRNASNIRLLFVGNGKMKPHLVQRAESEHLDNCIFLDTVPKREIAGIYKTVHVGLMVLQNVPAFYYGTSPNKFFDYIAAGLPVICNYPGWIAEMVAEHDCGYAVSPGDAVAFADRLTALAADPVARQRMSGNARKLAPSFDRDMLATRFVDVLEATAGDSREAPDFTVQPD